jgi:hypothetical protein
LSVTGALRDSTNAAGTTGMVFQTTGTGTAWVATSTLGISSGASTFLSLTDTPSSFTANRIPFTNSGATALTDSANFVFDGTNFGIGTTTPNSKLTIIGDTYITGTTTILGSIRTNAQSDTLTFVGVGAGAANTVTGIGTEGLYNSAFGNSALRSNTTGNYNTANGYQSLYSNTTGVNNTANGYYSLYSNTTGYNNTANGVFALHSNTTGYNNTALGYQAGYDMNTGTGTGANTFLGYNTGRGIVTGVNNTILGANVTGLSSTLSNNIIIADGEGNQRINVDASGNVGVGTLSPTKRLHIFTGSSGAPGTATFDGMRVESASSGGIDITTSDLNSGRLNFGSPSNSRNGAIWSTYNAGDPYLSFRTSNVEAMRINGIGNVGIGTTTPSSKLSIFYTVLYGSG